MKTAVAEPPVPVRVSIGILARNEEASLRGTLDSLFRQTLFAELRARGACAEIICVANACTDATASVASHEFAERRLHHPDAAAMRFRVVEEPVPGKFHAWNRFVHSLSAREAEHLVLMDADIRFGHVVTLANLCEALDRRPDAQVTVGEPIKAIALKPKPTLRERLSLATSRLARRGGGLITGQLYCIRAATARRVHLPRDLPACEDGFLKSLVCTDFLLRAPQPARILRVRNASHLFEPYLSPLAVLRNQKRQIIGQTFVHVLVDQYLPGLPPARRRDLARTLRRLDDSDPPWLSRLVAAHVRRHRACWRLFPGLLTHRLRRLAGLPWASRLAHLPAGLAGLVVTLAASWLAARALRRGDADCWVIKPGRGEPYELEPTARAG